KPFTSINKKEGAKSPHELLRGLIPQNVEHSVVVGISRKGDVKHLLVIAGVSDFHVGARSSNGKGNPVARSSGLIGGFNDQLISTGGHVIASVSTNQNFHFGGIGRVLHKFAVGDNGLQPLKLAKSKGNRHLSGATQQDALHRRFSVLVDSHVMLGSLNRKNDSANRDIEYDGIRRSELHDCRSDRYIIASHLLNLLCL